MGKITEIISKPKVVTQYIAEVAERRTSKENIYNLAFNKEENGRWYIDLPQWRGPHGNLQMVAGADTLLDTLLTEGNRVEVEVIKSDISIPELEIDSDIVSCQRKEYHPIFGATYDVHGLEDHLSKMWICPVTLFVLGEYPIFLYIRKLN